MRDFIRKYRGSPGQLPASPIVPGHPGKKTHAIQLGATTSKQKLALKPKHPERICWGCDKYCSADDLRCGNGTIRTQHPVELFGQNWLEWELNAKQRIGGDLANSGDPNKSSSGR